MQTRDEIIVKWAKQVQAAPIKTKKLVVGKAEKAIQKLVSDKDGVVMDKSLHSELLEEFYKLAYK